MLAPSHLSKRQRQFAAAVIHRVWAWVTAVGTISPDDARGRRFASLGAGSCLSFPPGALMGEARVAIGASTLIGPNVAIAVGMPGEPFPPGAPPVIVIGDRCNIGRASSLVARSRIEIEDDVTTGPNVYITDHNHSYDNLDVPIARQWPTEDTVRIGAGSWLGANAVILPGTDIGRHVVVAAGAVVRGTIPDNSVVAGSPARVVRRYHDGAWDPPLPERVVNPPAGWTPA